METLNSVLLRLVAQAKQRDTLGTAATLLGPEPGSGAIEEARALIEGVLGITNGPLIPGARVRLLLLLYEHLVVFREVYDTLGNLLNIARGEPYRERPLVSASEPKFLQVFDADESIQRLVSRANEAGETELALHIRYAWMPEVRRAFEQNLCWISDTGRVVLQGGAQEVVEGVPRTQLASEWVSQRAEAWIGLVEAFATTVRQARREYFDGETLEGALGEHRFATAVVEDGYGLVGIIPQGV